MRETESETLWEVVSNGLQEAFPSSDKKRPIPLDFDSISLSPDEVKPNYELEIKYNAEPREILIG